MDCVIHGVSPASSIARSVKSDVCETGRLISMASYAAVAAAAADVSSSSSNVTYAESCLSDFSVSRPASLRHRRLSHTKIVILSPFNVCHTAH